MMIDLKQILQSNGYAIFHIDSSVQNKNLPDDSRLSMMVLCEDGSAVLEGNMQRVTLTKGSRLLGAKVFQTKILEVSPDFQAWVLLVADSFSRDITVGMPFEKLGNLVARPVKQVTDDQEWELLIHLMKCLYMYDTMRGGKHTFEVTGCIFRSMLLVMVESETEENGDTKVKMYTMADTYFRDFVHLVSEHSDKEHEVAFYANRLNITTKYLSDICKQKTEKGAKELISEILISKLKREIRLSGLSLKEIAYKYAFADQSSMGKFFRKMTGLSPLAFKQAGGVTSE